MSLSYPSDDGFQASISTQEMFNVSDEISRDFSPTAPIKLKSNPTKINLSCKELLEASQNISLYYAPKLSSSTKELTLLSIAPQQFYTYWNLGEKHSHLLLSTMHNNELVLRIYAQPEQRKPPVNSKSIFECPIHKIQGQQKIRVPSVNRDTMYSATIGKSTSNNEFFSLIISNELHTLKENNLTRSIKEDKGTNNSLYSKDKLIDFISSPFFSSMTKSYYPSTNRSGRGKNTIL